MAPTTRSATGKLPTPLSGDRSTIDKKTSFSSKKQRRTSKGAKFNIESTSTASDYPEFPLMKLPTEIRLEILKMLLWQKTPIRYETAQTTVGRLKPKEIKNYDFCPQILCTCHQIEQEGKGFLYANSFQISVWNNDLPFQMFGMLLAQDFTQDYPRALLKKFVRIHIDVYVHRIDLKDSANPIVFDELYDHRATLLHLGDHLQSLSQLQEISIQVKHGSRTFDPENELRDKFLQPLGILRGLRSVEFIGVSDHYAAELRTLMTGNTKSENMVKMVRDLQESAPDLDSEDEDDDSYEVMIYDLIQDARNHMYNYDLEQFRMARRSVIHELLAPVAWRVLAAGEEASDIFEMAMLETREMERN